MSGDIFSQIAAYLPPRSISALAATSSDINYNVTRAVRGGIMVAGESHGKPVQVWLDGRERTIVRPIAAAAGWSGFVKRGRGWAFTYRFRGDGVNPDDFVLEAVRGCDKFTAKPSGIFAAGLEHYFDWSGAPCPCRICSRADGFAPKQRAKKVATRAKTDIFDDLNWGGFLRGWRFGHLLASSESSEDETETDSVD